ncbi:uncharacterized protein LOC134783507 [Penaeus indicus]|uniref:uncharacterized protein LOC134783507 n=1 Tax=Penaeus indicus TaxID=29960 RepID=UPI00300CFFCD
MVSVMKAGPNWRQIGLLNLLLVASLSRGEIYETRQMEQIKEYRSEDVEICVKPLSSEVELKVVLMVKSTASPTKYDAGSSLIKQESLAPVDSLHKLSIKHVTPEYKHNLIVKVDSRNVSYNFTGKDKWFTTSFAYEKIILYAKGKVEVMDCNALATTADPNLSWSIGGMPVVLLTIVAVVVLAVSIILCVVCWRKRSQAKRKATKAAQLEGFRHTDYQVVDTRDEMEGNKEGPRKDEDARLNQTMDDSYEPVMNHGRPLTTFSNSGTDNQHH